MGERRSATVVAAAPCELWSLSRASLSTLLGRWPELLPDFEGMLAVQPGACAGAGGKRGRIVMPGGVLGQVLGTQGGLTTREQNRIVTSCHSRKAIDLALSGWATSGVLRMQDFTTLLPARIHIGGNQGPH
jgi:hypothetical protein